MKIGSVIIMLTAVAVLLLMVGVVLAQSGGGGLSAPYTVEQGPALSTVEGMASGGGYRLTVLAWRVEGVTNGTGYSLSPAAPTLRGSGCCCTFLPCVLRNY